jgi:hypothetical protein
LNSYVDDDEESSKEEGAVDEEGNVDFTTQQIKELLFVVILFR